MGRKLSSPLRAATMALLLASLAASVAADGRIVAVGDVHGAYGSLLQILQTAKLVDENGTWSGGDSTLVQTGDLVERGTEVRKVLDLMMALEDQAANAGGRVLVLLGNHEVTSLLAYLDYESTPPEVYRQIFASFADQNSGQRRARALKQWKRWRTRFPGCGKQSKAEWEAAHPPGFVEYFEALSPTGLYGRWLRSLPTAALIGTTLFSHAGPSPWLVEQGVTSVYMLNRSITRELESFDRARAYLLAEDIILPFFTLSEIYCAVTEELVRTPEAGRPAKYYIPLTAEQRRRLLEIRESLPNVETSMTLRGEGPLWYRGYTELDGETGSRLVDEVLETFGARDLVLAHSTVQGQIQRRLDRLYFIDTGMVYSGGGGGRPAALEIASDGFTALYPGEVERLGPSRSSRAIPAGEGESEAKRRRWLNVEGGPLPLDSASEVEEFLRSARVVGSEPLKDTVDRAQLLRLEQYGMLADAVFASPDEEERDRRFPTGKVARYSPDSYRNDIAAYRLARLLGVRGVHPAVEREIDGVTGSVQLWHEDVISEEERIDRSLQPPDRLAWRRQIDDLRVFDNLINNRDRNNKNVLVSPDWMILPVDHSRSFGLDSTLPDPDEVERCSRDLLMQIEALDGEVVTRELGTVLREAEIEALLRRRDALLERLRSLVTVHGEDEVIFDASHTRTASETRPSILRTTD